MPEPIEHAMDEIDRLRVLAALRTQYIGLRVGNVYQDEANGTADDIHDLYIRLGGDENEWPAKSPLCF